MKRRVHLISVSVLLVAILTGCLPGRGTTFDKQRVTTELNSLPVRAEQRTGYDRSLFRHWIDVDKNGCNTRYEVLIKEATKAPKVGTGCKLTGGEWTSDYDGIKFTDPSKMDIDHMIALAEAWDSGAHGWTATKREQFANDLKNPEALTAVSASSNRSKGDRDPAEWMPAQKKCQYLSDWVRTKKAHGLSVDQREKTSIIQQLKAC